MIILLISTSGMTLYRLNCKCLHHKHISVFIEPKSCHADDNLQCNDGDCQCSLANHQHKGHSASACDTHEAVFVKLATEFITEDNSNEISPVLANIIEIYFNELINQQYLKKETFFTEVVDCPPPLVLSGQKIVALFHQFKFDEHPQLA